jgi:hypothetical protein
MKEVLSMRRKPPTADVGAQGLRLAAAALSLLMVGGCANSPADTATAGSTYPTDRADRQTGSNLPRRSGQTSQVIIADPAAVQSNGRAATRGTGVAP